MSNNTNLDLPDPIEDYIAARNYNATEHKRQLAEKDLAPGRFYFLCGKTKKLLAPNTHSADVSRKIDDILAGAAVGAIPYLTQNGDDALLINDDHTVEPIELKLSMISREGIWMGDRGGLYKGSSYANKVSITSLACACYEIVKNLEHKNRTTYFVVMDKDLYRIIDCYKMDGQTVIAYLTTNQSNGLVKKSKKRDIKFGSFMKSGKRVLLESAISFGAWKNLAHYEATLNNYEAKVMQSADYLRTCLKLYEDGGNITERQLERAKTALDYHIELRDECSKKVNDICTRFTQSAN